MTPEQREAKRVRDSAYYAAHREERRTYFAAYNAAHREKQRVYAAAHNAAYKAAHREEMRAYSADYHAAHREERRVYNAAYNVAHKDELRAYNAAYKAELTEWLHILRTVNGCEDCETHEGFLDHHHVDPTTKLYNVSQMYTRSLDALEDELEKCVVLCRPCHTKRHVEMRAA